jgi:CDP-6-deoxy-D-xylo-4-hexulose-3-dehydrase
LEDYDGIIDHKYVFSHMGYNLKPIDVTGAVGLVQLEKLDEICDNRNWSKYSISLLFNKYFKAIGMPIELPKAETVWFGTPLICQNEKAKHSLVSHLEKNKIQTRNYFAGNLLLHPGYKHLGNWKDYPKANEIYDRVFFLGASPSYNQKVIDYIEEILEDYE